MKSYNLPNCLFGNRLLYMVATLFLLANIHCKKDKQVKATDCAECWKRAWPGVYALTSLKYDSLETKQMFEELYGPDCRFLIEYVEQDHKGDFTTHYYNFEECLKISISTAIFQMGHTYIQPTKIRWPFRIIRSLQNKIEPTTWHHDTLSLHDNLVNVNFSGIILQPHFNELTLIFYNVVSRDTNFTNGGFNKAAVFKVELSKILE